MVQLAGEDILASDVVVPLFKRKVADESKTSLAASSNDAELVSLALSASKTYLIEFYAGATCAAAAADIRIQWAVTGGCAILGNRLCTGPSIGTTDVTGTAAAATTVGPQRASWHGLTTAVTYGCDATTFQSGIQERFIIETTTAGTAGTLSLQWAQSVSTGTATILKAGTYMVITEIEAF